MNESKNSEEFIGSSFLFCRTFKQDHCLWLKPKAFERIQSFTGKIQNSLNPYENPVFGVQEIEVTQKEKMYLVFAKKEVLPEHLNLSNETKIRDEHGRKVFFTYGGYLKKNPGDSFSKTAFQFFEKKAIDCLREIWEKEIQSTVETEDESFPWVESDPVKLEFLKPIKAYVDPIFPPPRKVPEVGGFKTPKIILILATLVIFLLLLIKIIRG